MNKNKPARKHEHFNNHVFILLILDKELNAFVQVNYLHYF